MTLRRNLIAWAAFLVLFTGCHSVGAVGLSKSPQKPSVHQAPREPSATAVAGGKDTGGLIPGAGSKEPIAIASDRLVFLNKENKLIYEGNVLAVQGASTLKATKLNIDLQRTVPGGTPALGDASSTAGNSSVRHMEADGPVTISSKDQIGTGDHASYDKGENKVHLDGHVTLTQGCDVVQGDALVYDMPSGRADVTGNVKSIFTPRSGPADGSPQKRC